MAEEAGYANIRDVLGWAIGKRIEDITQHTAEEWEESRESYIMLMLEGGGTIRFIINDGGFYHDNPLEPPEPDQEEKL